MKVLTLFLICIGLVGSARANVLTPLDPVDVDNNYVSGFTGPAIIDFINNTSMDLDLYWIDYSGDRVFYGTILASSSYLQYTFIPHPWLLVEDGTGGTTVQGTGNLVAAFMAVTDNPNWDTSLADVAIIGSVPEASSSLALLGLGLIGIAGLRRQFAK